MPYKDPVLAKACKQRWHLKNLEREQRRARQRSAAGEWKTPAKKKKLAEYYAKNKDRLCAQNRSNYKKRVDRDPHWLSAKHYKLFHGISLEQRDALFAQNGGLCWICSKRVAELVDHCHNTMEIRGALCNRCNCGIGFLEDDFGLVLRAAQYLKTKKPIEREG